MTRLTTLLFMGITGLAMSACPGSDTNRVDEGDYAVSSVQGHDGTDLAEIQAAELTVDRSNQSASFTLAGGTQLTVEWNDTRWISGCPTMQGSTKLEVVEISDATLLIGSMEFVNPVLAATCGDEIVLTEATSAATGSSPCGQSAAKCLTFQRTP